MKKIVFILILTCSYGLWAKSVNWESVHEILKGKNTHLLREVISFLKNEESPKAYHALGIIYGFDEFGVTDRKKGLEYLIKSASNGWRDAYVDLGTLYYLDGNFEKAAVTYRQAIKRYDDITAKESLYLLYNNEHLDYDEYAKELLNELVALNRTDFILIKADIDIVESIDMKNSQLANKTLKLLSNCLAFNDDEAKSYCHHLIAKLYLVEVSPIYNMEKGLEHLHISATLGNELSKNMYQSYIESGN
ncbi:tetratricopeptide repeat protein [Pseudoalteromonas phenolica]|uniref:tetratricopeptide repeat protein n=1 Tax=Pseudoalteromonas phenolica TaxID=161398 RepID=UPI00110A5313|nr:hypothetical protein [Pseudoalteromonas phenolica]TMO54659.1 hypothetical protein CWC21_14900 [Pseudoalteromonas phenolica]